MPLLYAGTGYDPFPESRKPRGGTAAGIDTNLPQTSMEELQKKYLSQIPRADIPSDPEKIYGGLMGPARQDVNRATEQIGLGLQKHATGGSSYEDMLSRYLPGAIEPLADVASRASAQSQEFAQKGAVAQGQHDVARVSAANEMAAAERSMQNEMRRFMLDLKARIQMAEREIAAKERMAASQARSQAHLARINNNAAMERQRVQVNAQMEAQRFGQTQENYRNNVRMQVYDKWYTGNIAHQERQDALAAAEFASKYGRTGVPTQGKPLPTVPGGPATGTGYWSFGGQSGMVGPGGTQPTQAFPGMTYQQGYYGPPQGTFQDWNQYQPEPFTQEQRDARFRSM